MLSPEELLMQLGPPGQLQRKREWQEIHEQSGRLPGFLCDLDHHPGRGSGLRKPSSNTNFPLQLTHGTITELKSGEEEGAFRIATPTEHFIAHGFHFGEHATVDCKECPLAKIISSLRLKRGDQKVLAGNGMNLVTQTAWMLWCLSNSVFIEPEDRDGKDDSNGSDEWE